MTTVLVTAAAGNIGREIVGALAARGGVDVLAGSRRAQGASNPFQEISGVRVVELDLDRPETLARALEGVDVVCHVSPFSPEMGRQTREIVAAAQRAGARRLVRSSLIGVDDPEPITEGVWHGEADRAIQESGIPYTILRPNQYLQNFISARNAQTVKNQGALFLPLADAAVSNIDTRDIGEIAANVALAEPGVHDGKAYDLTGAEASTMHDVAAAIGEAIDKAVRYVPVTEEQTRQGLLGAGLPAVVADAILGWFGYCRSGKAARISPDAERLLGRKPRSLQQFARDHAHCYR
jgi:uncharacterized protein YbjT (DUF2867 family)